MPRASRKSKILIAAADTVLAAVMSDVFTSHGMAVVATAEPGEVIGLAEAEDPDVALLDESLLSQGDIQLTDSIRRHPRLAHLPIVVLAAPDQDHEATRAAYPGIDDLVKLKDADLVRRVLECVRQSRYRSLRTMQSGVDWIVENCDTGFLWIDGEGRSVGENATARRLLNLGPDPDPSQTLVEHLAQHFSLETRPLWRTWPKPTAQNTPRLLVSRTNGQPTVVLEVSVVPATFGPLRLVKIDDATSAYRQPGIAATATETVRQDDAVA